MLQFPIKYDRLGYRFGSRVYSGSKVALHSGSDLNLGPGTYSDLGLEIKPMYKGEVVYAKASGAGWGNLTVIYHPDLGVWSRYAHQQRIYVKVGQLVESWDIIGTVGKTGTTSPHLHLDIIRKELPKWTNYTWGWSRKKLEEYYYDPIQYINNSTENMIESLPDWTREDWKEAIASDLPFKDPNQLIDISEFQAMAKHYGLIKEVNKMPAYRANTLLLKWKKALNS